MVELLRADGTEARRGSAPTAEPQRAWLAERRDPGEAQPMNAPATRSRRARADRASSASARSLVLLGEVLALAPQDLPRARASTEVWIGSRARAGRRSSSSALAIYVAPAPPSRAAQRSPSTSTTRCSARPLRGAIATALIGARVAPGRAALSIAYLAELRINHGEYYALLLLSTAGMMLLVGVDRSARASSSASS